MIDVSLNFIRGSDNTKFPMIRGEFVKYVYKNYFLSGKLVSARSKYTNYSRTRTINLKFCSEKSFITFKKDRHVTKQWKLIKDHASENKIAISINTDNIRLTKNLYNLYIH